MLRRLLLILLLLPALLIPGLAPGFARQDSPTAPAGFIPIVPCDVTFEGPLILTRSGAFERIDPGVTGAQESSVTISGDAATREGPEGLTTQNSLTLSFVEDPFRGDGTPTPDVGICGVPIDAAATLTVALGQDETNWIEVGTLPSGNSGIDLDALGFGPDSAVGFLRLSVVDTGADPAGAALATIAAQATRIAELEGALFTPTISPTNTPLPTNTPDAAQATIVARAAQPATPEAAQIVLHADTTQLRVGEDVRVRAEATGLGLTNFSVRVRDAQMTFPVELVTIDSSGQAQRREGRSQVLALVEASGEASGFASTVEFTLRAMGPGVAEIIVGGTGEVRLADGALAWGGVSSDPLRIDVQEESADTTTPAPTEPATETPAPPTASATETPAPADPLGRVWNMTEGDGGWTAVWTRRGTTDVFDAVWTSIAGTQVTAVLTITIDGNQVFVQRRQASAGGDCDYVGTLSDDGRTVRGTFTCAQFPGPFDWEATITGLAPESDGPAAQAGPTPTIPPITVEVPLAADFITPGPAECTVPPRNAEDFAGLASAPDDVAIDESAGAPADAATTEAVVETYRQIVACINAGNALATYALWSDRGLRQLQAQPPAAAPIPLPEGARVAFRVTEVRVLPDGRVVAVWEKRGPGFTSTFVDLLVRQNDRYLIDAMLDAVFGPVVAQTPEAAAPAAAVVTATPGQPVKMMLLPKFLGISVFDQANQGAQEAAAELGNPTALDFVGPTAENSVAGQIEFVSNAPAGGYDVVMLSNNSGDQIVPAAEASQAAGTRIVTWDSPIPGGRGESLFVAQVDFTETGQVMADMALSILGEAGGKFAILSASSDAANQNAWIAAMEAALEDPKYANLELLEIAYGDDQSNTSYEQAQILIDRHPDMRLIMAPTSVGILSAAQAVQDRALCDKIKVSGLGVPSSMIEYTQAGCAPEFALWSFVDLGYLTYYVSYLLATGAIEGVAGERFMAGRLGEYEIARDPTRPDVNALRVVMGPFTIYTIDTIEEAVAE